MLTNKYWIKLVMLSGVFLSSNLFWHFAFFRRRPCLCVFWDVALAVVVSADFSHSSSGRMKEDVSVAAAAAVGRPQTCL